MQFEGDREFEIKSHYAAGRGLKRAASQGRIKARAIMHKAAWLLVLSFDATPDCRSLADCPRPGPTNELLAASADAFAARRWREHGQRVDCVVQLTHKPQFGKPVSAGQIFASMIWEPLPGEWIPQ